MATFKIYIGEEIRRFRVDKYEELTYENFTEKLRQNIPSYHLEMKTFYEDSDKDKIVFSCEMEFREMINHLSRVQEISETEKSGLPLIKIWVENSSLPYFKDGTAEIVGVYTKTKDHVLEKLESVTPSHEKIKAAVSRLFPDNTILPYHIPNYLQQFLKVKTKGTADVELEIEETGLAQAINEEALRLMNSNLESDLAKSKLLLESLSMIREDDPYVYYNLACAESLLKNVQSSVDQLKLAWQKGYNNFKHMLEDPDLAFLRLHEQYTAFLNAVLPNDSEILSTNNSSPEEVPKSEPKLEEPILEEPKPEMKDEPKVEVEVEEKPERWGDEIEVLKGMGFQLQASVFVDVLDHHKGNLQTAIQDLI